MPTEAQKTPQKTFQLKFFKDQVPFILSGKMTLEPRPRNESWIKNLMNTKEIQLTYGSRFRPPKVFAIAQVKKVEIRPFESVTKSDLKKISRGWEKKTPKEYAHEHISWFRKELTKGYLVAWIYFKVTKSLE